MLAADLAANGLSVFIVTAVRPAFQKMETIDGVRVSVPRPVWKFETMAHTSFVTSSLARTQRDDIIFVSGFRLLECRSPRQAVRQSLHSEGRQQQ
jgi:hypothetical protein